jgi:hypothetical protein
MEKKLILNLILLTSILVAPSCKKENSTVGFENKIKAAEEWYLKTYKKTDNFLSSTSNGIYQIEKNIIWDKAIIFVINQDSEILMIPIRFKFKNSSPLKGSNVLFLKKNKEGYTSTLLHNDDDDFFIQKIDYEDIDLLYNSSVQQNDIKIKKAADLLSTKNQLKIKTDVEDSGENQSCIDWYLTTIVYDDLGNVLFYDEVFLFSSCTDIFGNGGGGGVGSSVPDNDPNCSNIQNSLEAVVVSQELSSMTTETSSTNRKKIYEWMFLKNAYNMWDYVSREEGVHKKVGNEWQWESLTHLNEAKNGLTIGVAISVTDVSASSTVGIYNAGMTLYFQYTRSAVCKGTPVAVSEALNRNSPVFSSLSN